MPPLLEKLQKQIQGTGKSKSSSFAIATSALQKQGKMKRGSQELTSKGKSYQATHSMKPPRTRGNSRGR
jgi:hypothetical protein